MSIMKLSLILKENINLLQFLTLLEIHQALTSVLGCAVLLYGILLITVYI